MMPNQNDMFAQAQMAQQPQDPAQGVGVGQSKEEIIQNVTTLFEQAGLFEKSTKPEVLKQEIIKFAEAVIAKDMEALKESPIPAVIEKYSDQLAPDEQGLTQEPAAMAQAAGPQGMM